jgi:hypothetical protein
VIGVPSEDAVATQSRGENDGVLPIQIEPSVGTVTPGRPLAINYYQNIPGFLRKANELSTTTSRTVVW